MQTISAVKRMKISLEKNDIFNIFAQNIVGIRLNCLADAVLMSTHNLFWSKINKNRYTPAYPSFAIHIKVWYKEAYFTWTCYGNEESER